MTKALKRKPPEEDIIEIIDDVEQGSLEWHEHRRGIATASVFSTIMASGKDGGDSLGRTKLLRTLAGERITGEVSESYSNAAMDRGKRMEAEARSHFELTHGFAECRQVGFVRRTISNPLGNDWIVGCSPDSLIGNDGLLEIKTMAPHLLIELLERGRFPSEHKAQCHGSLWVTGRKFCILKIYYRGMPVSPEFRIERDDVYIQEIKNAVETFEWEVAQLEARIRKWGAK